MNEEQLMLKSRNESNKLRRDLCQRFKLLEKFNKYGKKTHPKHHYLSAQYVNDEICKMEKAYFEEMSTQAALKLKLIRSKFRVDLPTILDPDALPELPEAQQLEKTICTLLDNLSGCLKQTSRVSENRAMTFSTMLEHLENKYKDMHGPEGTPLRMKAFKFLAQQRESRKIPAGCGDPTCDCLTYLSASQRIRDKQL